VVHYGPFPLPEGSTDLKVWLFPSDWLLPRKKQDQWWGCHLSGQFVQNFLCTWWTVILLWLNCHSLVSINRVYHEVGMAVGQDRLWQMCHYPTNLTLKHSMSGAMSWPIQSPASHHKSPGSHPQQSMWHLWWTKCHWGRFLSESFSFPNNIIPPLLCIHSCII
jgi:hypothetical protein